MGRLGTSRPGAPTDTSPRLHGDAHIHQSAAVFQQLSRSQDGVERIFALPECDSSLCVAIAPIAPLHDRAHSIGAIIRAPESSEQRADPAGRSRHLVNADAVHGAVDGNPTGLPRPEVVRTERPVDEGQHPFLDQYLDSTLSGRVLAVSSSARLGGIRYAIPLTKNHWTCLSCGLVV